MEDSRVDLCRLYPNWDRELSMFRYHTNMLALEDEWDTILSMFSLESFNETRLLYLMKLFHSYRRDDLVDVILAKYPLSMFIRKIYIDPILVYTSWRLDLPEKKSHAIAMMYGTRRGFPVEDVIGYVTPEMRSYLLENSGWAGTTRDIFSGDLPLALAPVASYLRGRSMFTKMDIELRDVAIPERYELTGERMLMPLGELMCDAYNVGAIDGFDFRDRIVTKRVIECFRHQLEDNDYTLRMDDGPVILDYFLPTLSLDQRKEMITSICGNDYSPAMLFVIDKYT